MAEFFELLKNYTEIAVERLIAVVVWFFIISAVATVGLLVFSEEARLEAKEGFNDFIKQARQMFREILNEIMKH